MSADDAVTEALRDTLARYLDNHVDPARAMDDDTSASLWRGLARDLGLIGAAFPESVGGSGGGFAAHLAVLQTLGEALAAEPYLSTAVIAGGVLQRAGTTHARALLGRVIDGDAVIAWAHAEPGLREDASAITTSVLRDGGRWRLDGRKSAVQCGPWATHFIVSARSGEGPSLLLIDAATPGIERRDLRALDGGSISELRFDGVTLPDDALLVTEGNARGEIERALDEAALGACAEALGTTKRLLDDTLAYARERRQFSVPIASFQVLQHRLADMHIAREQAQALTHAVFDSSGAPAHERMLAVSSAKVAANRACRIVGQGAVQIHGAMGIADELAVGRYFRRATQIELMFGSTTQHLRRIDRIDRIQQGVDT